MERYDLGIDLGGTYIKYALVDEEYNIVEKWKIPTIRFDTKDEFYDYVCAGGKGLDAVNAIGVSSPGLIDRMSNVKSYASPNVRIMYGTNVNDEIARRTAKKVATINDAKSAGLCELKIGNGKGTKSSAYLIIGTGTGGCLCTKDDVVYGHDGFAGEFHFLPFIDYRDNTVGMLGDNACMRGLIKFYNSKAPAGYVLNSGEEIVKQYLQGDERARLAVEDWIKSISVQLLTIAVFYNPEVICIGGGISEEQWFIQRVQESFTDICLAQFPGAMPITTEIRRCKYNNDANILGAVINVRMKKQV